jgi:hypothetical protein
MMGGGPRHALEDPNLQPMDSVPADVGRLLNDHERLMLSLDLRGTPGIVFRGLDGRLVAKPGLTPEELPLVFGAL